MSSPAMPVIVAIVFLLVGVLFWFGTGRHRRGVK
ncbi:DUF4448 domain-containing protein [Limnoglobus roseus]|nr:DUF4448 domain-containing protein [Limnoglobus roseus]